MNSIGMEQAPEARYQKYDPWANLYDRTMGPEYGKAQLAWLEETMLPHVPKAAKLLDLCCGTGQLIAPLQALGYQLSGLDGSGEMLARAEKNAPGATMILDDARHFKVDEKFHGVLCTSASLNHIESIEELTQVFRRVYDAMLPDGVFVFDVNHPKQLEKWWRGRPMEGEIADTYAWYVTPYYDAQTARGRFTVTMFDGAGQQASIIARMIRRPLYRLLAHDRFIGLRLALLQKLSSWESTWARKDLDFPIVGHELDTIQSCLSEVGFSETRLRTIAGESPPDENQSAHFVCVKRSSANDQEASP